MRFQYPPTDPPTLPLRPAESSAPRTPTRASECFAEPVTYSKTVTIKPMAGDADTRLLRCGTSACRFGVAREYFEANRFERAGPLLLSLAHDANARALLLDPKNGLRQSEGAKRLLKRERDVEEARRSYEQFGRP